LRAEEIEGQLLQLWFVANTVLWPLKAKVGEASLGLNVVVLAFAGTFWLAKNVKITAGSAKISLGFLAYAIFSFVLAATGSCHDNLLKLIITVPVLIFLVLIGVDIGRSASPGDWRSLHRVALWSLTLAFSAFIVEMLEPAWFPIQQIYRAEGKFSGLFQEPSHVAFGMFPCVAVLLVAESKKMRVLGTLALLALLVFSRSTTLIGLIAAWLLYRLFVQRKLTQTALFMLAFVLLFGIGAAIDYERFLLPTIERVMGVASPSATENISSLVYVQGWQDAWFNLLHTRGTGLGLNMMGCGTLPDVSARSALTPAGLSDLNATDGSFLFAKVVSEAGIAGIAFYIVIIWWWVRLEKKLRHLAKNSEHFAVSAQTALIFSFVASSFIRSSGYFEGGLLLWVTAVGGASKWAQNFSTTSSTRVIEGSGSDISGASSR
jgi:hypothetical protein